MKKNMLMLVMVAVATLASGSAFADRDHKECPVQSVSGISLDEEFGSGAQEATRCLEHRKHVKVVYQINQFCEGSYVNGVCNKAYGLGNITNAIKDYEISHGMSREDYEIVVVFHSAGGPMLIKDSVLRAKVKGNNPFEKDIRNLMAQGVKVYMCQNTIRGLVKNGTLATGAATSELIEGVQFVTAGVTAIPDFQREGYKYVQP